MLEMRWDYKTKGHCSLQRERERECEAEKVPIMLCRIADRGLLFGYFANKILSLYEEWREERDSFITIDNKPILYIHILFYFSLFYIKRTNDKHGEGNFSRKIIKRHSSLSLTHTLWLAPLSFTLFEILLLLSVHSKGDVEKERRSLISLSENILNYGPFVDPFFFFWFYGNGHLH